MRLAAYVGKVVAANGSVVTCIVRGSSALAALHNLRRQRKGDWLHLAVGVGDGDAFRCYAEVGR